MKKVLVKKGAGAIAFAIVLGLVAFAACEQPTDSDPTPAPVEKGKGVVGQVSGVVYDSVTGAPISGVTVGIAEYTEAVETGAQTKPVTKLVTNDSGAYHFADVKVGEYWITFAIDGYRFAARKRTVSPREYITDDPFLEVNVLERKYQALVAWFATQENPDLPSNTDTGQVTYSFVDNYIVGSDGKAYSVGGAPDFKITEVFDHFKPLDYTYSKNMAVDIVSLAPLTASFKGKVLAINKVYTAIRTGYPEAAPAADVQVRFKEAGGFSVDGTGAQVSGVYTTKTGTDGSFEIKDLPAGVNFTIEYDSFTKDGFYFAEGSNVYRPTASGFSVISLTNPIESNDKDIGPVYVFTSGSGAFVQKAEAGTPGAALAVNGSIVLTFNKAIDPLTFKPTIASVSSNTTSSWGPGGTVALAAVWSENDTKVTLTSATPLAGQSTPSLPYSQNQGSPSANITINTDTKAADGSSVMNAGSTYQIPVYTKEGIKITGVVNLNPSDIPSRAAIARSAIKVTFSKEIGAVKAAWYTDGGFPSFATYSDDADAVISTENAKEVFIYLDGANTTTQRLRFAVVSKTDPGDTAGFNSSGEIDTSGTTNQVNVDITKGYLKLKATNLYTSNIPDASESKLPLTSPITLEFAELPAGAGVTFKAALYKGDTISAANLIKTKPITRDGNKITIALADGAEPLKSNTSYYLTVEVRENGVVVFDSKVEDCINLSKTVVATEDETSTSSLGKLIAFTTGDYLKLKKTNLYDMRSGISGGSPDAAEKQFPLAESITMEFIELPEEAEVKAALYKGNTMTAANLIKTKPITQDGNKITIALADGAEPLKYATKYYLAIEVKKNGAVVFDSMVEGCINLSKTVVATENEGTTPTPLGKLIAFTTEDYLKLKATNIYEKQDGYDPVNGFSPSADDANFPIEGPITLNFVSVPDGTKAEAKLYIVTTAYGSTTKSEVLHKENLTLDNSRLTISIPSTLPLLYDQEYYLDVVLKTANGVLSFDPSEDVCQGTNIADFVEQRYIKFKTTKEPKVRVKPLTDTNTANETSPALKSPSTHSIIPGPGYKYYLQFDGPVDRREATVNSGKIGITIQETGSTSTNFKGTVEKVTGRKDEDLLAITVTAIEGASITVDTVYTVSIKLENINAYIESSSIVYGEVELSNLKVIKR